jgi:hypothetical protein
MLWCFTEGQVTKIGEASWKIRGANPWTGAPVSWQVVREAGGVRLKDVEGAASTAPVIQDDVQQTWSAAASREPGPEAKRLLRASDARAEDSPLPLLEAYAILSATHGEAWKARQLLEELVRRRNAAALTPAEWLVLGLLAERHGLMEDARTALAKARASADHDPMVAAFFRQRSEPAKPLVLGSRVREGGRTSSAP